MNYFAFSASVLTLLLAGCTNSLVDRSLIFSTNTSFGLEVSVNPSESDSPAKLQIGYKRTEGVLDPVFFNLEGSPNQAAAQGRTVSDFYLKDAYSVLAKFTGSATASGGASSNTTVSTTAATGTGAQPSNTGTLNASVNGGMTLSQWFATGEAAKILARYGGGALSDNPGVAAAVSVAARSSDGTLLDSGQTSPVVSSIANQLYTALSNISSGATPASPAAKAEATRIVSLLDSSSLVSKVPQSFQPYVTVAGANYTYNQSADVLAGLTGFRRCITYWTSLDSSIDALQQIKTWIASNQTVTGPGGTAIDATAKGKLLDELSAELIQQQQWQSLLQRDRALPSMFEILAGQK